jgi:hypothetical protein
MTQDFITSGNRLIAMRHAGAWASTGAGLPDRRSSFGHNTRPVSPDVKT